MPLTIVGQLFIADQPVDPGIGNSDLKRILANPDKFRDVRSERRFPEDADKCTVEPNFGDVPEHPQIKHNDFVLANPIGWNFKFPHISCRAGEVSDAGIGMPCPRDQSFKLHFFWRAPIGREANFPVFVKAQRFWNGLDSNLLHLARTHLDFVCSWLIRQQFHLPFGVDSQIGWEADE